MGFHERIVAEARAEREAAAKREAEQRIRERQEAEEAETAGFESVEEYRIFTRRVLVVER